MKLKDLVKTAAPIALGAIAPGLAPGMNPLAARALASGVGSMILGAKPKDALLSAALSAGVGAMFPGQQAQAEQMSGSNLAPGAMGGSYQSKAAANAATKIPSGGPPGGSGFGALKGAAPLAKSKTMSGGLLQSLGFAGEDEGNLLFKILNTKLGEGVAAGLIAQLLAGGDENGGGASPSQSRPFGAGGPGGQIGGINYAQGGAVPSLQQLSAASARMAQEIQNMAGGMGGGLGARVGIGGGVSQDSAINNNRPPVGPGGGIGPLPVNPTMGQTDLSGARQPTTNMQNQAQAGLSPFANPLSGIGGLAGFPRQFFKDGGEAYFPRRNGGIDPSEGSGKKDDVPAMLMAGEFVMTRDAVKGMGDGNLRKGIDRMYGMMDNLERMA
jgi:hypothetical protein